MSLRSLLRALPALLALVTSCAFDPSSYPSNAAASRQSALATLPSRNLMTVSEPGRVRLLDTRSGDTLAEGTADDGVGFRDAAISSDGARIALTTWSGRLVVVGRVGPDLRIVAKADIASGYWGPVYRADGALAVRTTARVDVWRDGDVTRPPVTLDLEQEPSDLAFRPTDGRLGIAFSDRVETWNLDPPRMHDRFIEPTSDHVAFAGNGRLAAGGPRLVVRAVDGAERVLEGPRGCQQLAWDESGAHLACRGTDGLWICSADHCEAFVEPDHGEQPFSLLAPAADGFYLSRGDGRVLHHTGGSGEVHWLLTDGVVDRRTTR